MVDYDYEWKILLENHFEKAIAFFLPEIYHLVDFNAAPVFLEQEIHDTIEKMVEGKKQKRKYADKLAKVRFKDGVDRWILIHIEVQSSFQSSFSKRMFEYYYWISTKYNNPDIIALAIYTGHKISKKHNVYERKFYGTRLTYEFNTYQVRKQDEAELLSSDNPFALAILASLYILKTNKDIDLRFQYKRKLVELTREKGYSRAEIIGLLRFIRYIVNVPMDLTLQLDVEIANYYLKIYSDMTIPTKQDEKFVNDIYKAVMGISVEEIKLKASHAEQEKLRLEQEKFQAEQEKFQAEQEKFQAEQEKLLAIRKLILLQMLSNEQIAEIQSISVEEVEKIREELEN